MSANLAAIPRPGRGAVMVTRREFRPAVRQAALARAYYRCEQCGSRERLELHHIGNRQDRSAFNAMVLCVRCHAKASAVASVWELGTIVPASPGAAAYDRRNRFGGRPPPAWSGPQG